MQPIIINYKVRGVDIICRRCGNFESTTSVFLARFRLEGTGEQSAVLRCLSCQTSTGIPRSALDTLTHARAG
ncbi:MULTISPECIES: hypothetical protein [Halomonadaceae]|uniref:Uncharacterized protein n=1 Tax=Vreelandella janggokensis TaxID=370767 RepID=A0ABT4IR26_9GAMM|nr:MULTISPECIES: hypothetical protein [Halomonas]MCZ0925606.1 hypothetical protein [Halomonas janggokensis]MDR5886883.1 hypothetical protein [Halomonas janggokensis]